MNPSIKLYFWFTVGIVVVGGLILALLQQQGKEPITWLKTSPAGGGDSPLSKLGKLLSSVSALSVYAMLSAGIVLELVQPEIYSKWLGSSYGWAYFFAGVISLIVGGKLISSGKEPLKYAGIILIFVGFLSPLILSTKLGYQAAEKWDKMTEGNFLTVTTDRWSEMYKLAPGEKLIYNRVDQGACILVRHGGDDKMVKLIGGCEPPEEYKAAKGAEIPKDAVAKGLEFRAVGKPTKLELNRS